MRRTAVSANLTIRCETSSSLCLGTWRAILTTGQVSWEAAVGQAGGPRPWSITKRIGRASGTGEGNCGKAALVLGARRQKLGGRMGLRLQGSENGSVCPSRLSCLISLWLLNIPFPHVLSKGTRGTMCRSSQSRLFEEGTLDPLMSPADISLPFSYALSYNL